MLVSIAVPFTNDPGALYIAIKTRISSCLSVSIDAQFDHSTSREDLVDNAWNRWLVERCGDVIGAIAIGLLKEAPRTAWKVIPVSSEKLGNTPGQCLVNSLAKLSRVFASTLDRPPSLHWKGKASYLTQGHAISLELATMIPNDCVGRMLSHQPASAH